MTSPALRPFGRLVGLSLLLGSFAPVRPACAQPPPVPAPELALAVPDLGRAPLLPADVTLGLGGPAAAAKGNRIQLFRIQPGFLVDPLGVIDDDPPAVAAATLAAKDADADWINVTLGNDNPYFDFRRRGDPGGLGYYRVNTQVQLFDSTRTSCSFGLGAYAPAGLEYNGLADSQGAKVLSPALSLYHSLDEDTAVQGYVSKNLMVQQAGGNPVEQNLRYGMALQHSLNSMGNDSLRNVYLSVGAMGLLRTEGLTARPTASWDVLPGVHWKVADNCWLSGGVLVPVTASSRSDTGNWQFTCRFQF